MLLLGRLRSAVTALNLTVPAAAREDAILNNAFLAEVRNLPERNLAVELLTRLIEGEIKSRFAGNAVRSKKLSTNRTTTTL